MSDKKKNTKKQSKADKEAELKKEFEMDEHKLSVKELQKKLDTNVKKGLSEAERAARLEKWGRNALDPPKSVHPVIAFLKELSGFFSLLLWAGSLLSLLGFLIDPAKDLSNLYVCIVLAVVVLVTGIFTFLQNRKSDDVMKKFANFLPQFARVYIDGELIEVDVATLVPGDIVEIKLGDKIPADVRMIEVQGLKVDNSSLTGEPEPLLRTVDMTDERPLETRNIAFYATLATEGTARGVVIFTGSRTVMGKIAGLASGTKNEETPIHKEIDYFIKLISVVAITLGITFFALGVGLGNPAEQETWINNLVFMIGIIVANVPEGLLATVTVSLTLTAERMKDKNVLVKNLESVETLGSTTCICSDKTGTLTQNKMTAAHVFYNGKIFQCNTPTQEATYDEKDPTFVELLRIATMCNTTKFVKEDLAAGKDLQECDTIPKDASEAALIKLAQPIRDIEEARDKNPRVFEIPFNSANKYHVVIIKQEKSRKEKRLMLMMKGAPERVRDKCSHIMLKDGSIKKFDKKRKKQFQKVYEELGGMGERVLGFCQKVLPAKPYNSKYEFDDTPNFPLENMVFVGLIALIDPPRPNVPGAVNKCQTAGIRVIMVTGDHPITAQAIARQVNIIREESRTLEQIAAEKKCKVEEVDELADAIVLHGTEIAEIETETRWDEILDHQDVVFARTSPQQKLVIVENNQRRNEVVAVTGDGVNDSPALKKADIGVAMGITGSDVSKEAADMILLDDNFASIVDGVLEGRLIFDNLKKSIAYTLTSNIPEITPFLTYITFQIPLPLSTLLILCIDLGTDLVPAISLAYETAESDIMDRPPRNSLTDHLVNAKLIGFAYLQIGLMQALAGFFTYFTVLSEYNIQPKGLLFTGFVWGSEDYLIQGKSAGLRQEALSRAQAAYFCSIVVVQWADLLICKTRRLSLFQQGMKNRILIFGLFSETALALFLMYQPWLNPVLGSRPIMFLHWLPGLPFSVLILVYDEIRKFLLRKSNPEEDSCPESCGNWLEKHTYY